MEKNKSHESPQTVNENKSAEKKNKKQEYIKDSKSDQMVVFIVSQCRNTWPLSVEKCWDLLGKEEVGRRNIWTLFERSKVKKRSRNQLKGHFPY